MPVTAWCGAGRASEKNNPRLTSILSGNQQNYIHLNGPTKLTEDFAQYEHFLVLPLLDTSKSLETEARDRCDICEWRGAFLNESIQRTGSSGKKIASNQEDLSPPTLT